MVISLWTDLVSRGHLGFQNGDDDHRQTTFCSCGVFTVDLILRRLDRLRFYPTSTDITVFFTFMVQQSLKKMLTDSWEVFVCRCEMYKTFSVEITFRSKAGKRRRGEYQISINGRKKFKRILRCLFGGRRKVQVKKFAFEDFVFVVGSAANSVGLSLQHFAAVPTPNMA